MNCIFLQRIQIVSRQIKLLLNKDRQQKMGNENTNIIVDPNGKQIIRKCIIYVIPPGFEVNRMIQNFPQQFPYRYISVGQLIRHEINKKTKYSKIILEALEKHKKISKELLGILLRTVALRGNFMIRFSVLDDDELSVWKEFISKVEVEMIAIIKPSGFEEEQQQNQANKKQEISKRLSSFQNEVKMVKSSFEAKTIREFSQNDDIATEIMNFIRKNSS